MNTWFFEFFALFSIFMHHVLWRESRENMRRPVRYFRDVELWIQDGLNAARSQRTARVNLWYLLRQDSVVETSASQFKVQKSNPIVIWYHDFGRAIKNVVSTGECNSYICAAEHMISVRSKDNVGACYSIVARTVSIRSTAYVDWSSRYDLSRFTRMREPSTWRHNKKYGVLLSIIWCSVSR